MEPIEGPSDVVWDLTYACPLRCVHCYSESGRRPSRRLSDDDMLRTADAIISLKPDTVTFSGGEPFLVKGIFELAHHISQAGIQVLVYTSGWLLETWMTERMAQVFSQVHVSVDGATPDVHDRVRRRAGSFDRAMEALAMLDSAARDRRKRGEQALRFGIDCVVLRSNFHQMEQFCTTIVPRFPHLRFIAFGAVSPCGLASRASFGEHELLTEEQFQTMGSAGQSTRLQSLVPNSVKVITTDNRALQMHPKLVESGQAFRAMLVEPDGEVRAMPNYEGTVGNILTEPPTLLWERAVARWSDPFVTEALAAVRTVREWSEATRIIDYHFGSDEVRARISKRPEFLPLAIS